MLTTARFEILEEIRVLETPFQLDFLARAVDREPVMPPVERARERGRAREAAGA